MKKLFIIAIASVAFVATPAFADSVTAVVNYAKIMHDSKAGTSVRTQIQAKQKSLQSDVEAKEKDLYAQDQSLVKQKDTTDKAAFDKKVSDFRAKAADEQREVQGKKVALDKSAGAALEEIQKNVLEITKQIATEKKYNLVLSSTQVMYADDSLDITDEVMKRLDAKLPTVAVKF